MRWILLLICIPRPSPLHFILLHRSWQILFVSQYFFVPCRLLLKHQIMIKEDGLDHNVIKIKPPLCFTKENADTLVKALENTLKELGKWSTAIYHSHSPLINSVRTISVIYYGHWFERYYYPEYIFCTQNPYFICVCFLVAAACPQCFSSCSSLALAYIIGEKFDIERMAIDLFILPYLMG